MDFFGNLFETSNKNEVMVTGLNRELNCIYVYDYFIKYNKNLLVVASSLFEANDLYNRFLNYTDRVLFFPMDDFMTSEVSSLSPELLIDRLTTLNRIISGDNFIVVTNLMGVLRYLPSRDLYESKIVNLSVNLDINRDELLYKFLDLGYERVPLVTKTGEIAVRGFVIDIFPIGADNPIRIEFWGDTIDTIRIFDIDSQVSDGEIDSIDIYPFSEFLVNNKNSIDSRLFKQKYLPHFSDSVVGIWDYFDGFTFVYYDYDRIISSYNILRESIVNYDNELNDSIKTNYMFDVDDISFKSVIYLLEFNNLLEFNVRDKFNYSSFSIDNFNGDYEVIKRALADYLKSGKTIILCIDDKAIVKRVVNYLDIANDVIFTDSDNIIDNRINIVDKYIVSGFVFGNYVVISSNDLFSNIYENKKSKSKYKVGSKISNINNLEKGDYIVHIDHGIGQYLELCTLVKGGIKKDYIKLLYADGDILYLPVEKIDKITKFNGRDGINVKLDSLNSDSWNKKKARVRSKLRNIAGDLIRVSAERENSRGFAFSKDDENQILFESKFKFRPTDDQLSASEIIKTEMEKSKPMDMLLCGDVGYGKTEVAFRAMFKAVNDGKQVAYLCPTTILSSQQYKAALERFSDFPINIALINRFTSAKDQRVVFENIQSGKIDILFGTHKLFNDNIRFKDLGLLVIDEEQRFGVVHKEKIKKYKTDIDVLTLSATPIPRTLQMSMSGIRGMALIETPPEKRRPIQTYVMPESNSIIKDAIYKELSRNGQVYILYNSIEKIDYKVSELKKMVPEVNIRYAHGRMSKDELENIMTDFIDHKFDILLCTTIIEIGIDIPNVNTLIVLNADRFGLSQLYQIRGRIGRSDRIGYAYFMYDNRKELNDLAVKRLDTLKEFTELGSGFKIAMRDLAIRGAGDVLGSEQSGFIDSVGIDLYLKMLKDEVDKLKGTYTPNNDDSVKPLIEVETHISSDYAPDDEIKLEIHKLINDINSKKDIDKLCKILKDRFGTVTDEMVVYMHEEWFEKQAKALNITDTKQTKNCVEIVLPEDISKRIDGEKLFYASYEISKFFSFSYSNNMIHICLNTTKLEKHFVYYLNDLLVFITDNLKK